VIRNGFHPVRLIAGSSPGWKKPCAKSILPSWLILAGILLAGTVCGSLFWPPFVDPLLGDLSWAAGLAGSIFLAYTLATRSACRDPEGFAGARRRRLTQARRELSFLVGHGPPE
jgi:cobalamin biosynthesis protein CobD/CbiB